MAVSDDLFSNRDLRLRTAELERCSEDISMGEKRGLGLAGDLRLISFVAVKVGGMECRHWV